MRWQWGSWTKSSPPMFCLNDTMRYFLCPGKTDMRRGMNSLCGLVQDHMGHELRKGDVFIFIGSRKTIMKLLHMEDGGLVLYHLCKILHNT